MIIDMSHPFAPYLRVFLEGASSPLSYVLQVELRQRGYVRQVPDQPEERGTFHHLDIDEYCPIDTKILMELLLKNYMVGA